MVYIYTYIYIHIHIYIYESLNESFFLLTGKIYVLHLYIYIMYVALFEIIGGIIFFEYCIAVFFSSVNKKENKKKRIHIRNVKLFAKEKVTTIA